ncbi:MAG: carbon monoxide dehydrogenase subunit G [Sphingomonadales bacterium]
MDMNGEYRIPAPRQRVWEALNDPNTLGRCIPGCESIRKTGENAMSAVVQAKVGPVSARFTGEVTLEDIDPPNGYTIRGEGKGGVAGFAKGTAKVALSDDGDGTLLTYKVDAQVGGKLAQVGARLVAGTVKKMADEFFGTFSEIVGAPQPAMQSQSQSQLQAPPPEAAPVAAVEPPAPVRPDPAGAVPPMPKKSWSSPATIGILVVAAALVLYFLLT